MIGKNLKYKVWYALPLAGAVVGCGGDPITPTPPPAPAANVQTVAFVPNAAAGVPVPPIADPATLYSFVTAKAFASRPDPFALLPSERAYEQQQLAENLQTIGGTFPMYANPAPISVPPPQWINEPQPYRRLAGILLGETVTALIDMGDGRGLLSIRPGMRIPNSEWIVQSIDSEKAILRRIPGVRKRPTEVTVRLESPPPGLGPAPTQPQNNDPGNDPCQTPPNGVEFDDR